MVVDRSTVTGPSTGSMTQPSGWASTAITDRRWSKSVQEDVINGRPSIMRGGRCTRRKGATGTDISNITVSPGDSVTASVQYITAAPTLGSATCRFSTTAGRIDAFGTTQPLLKRKALWHSGTGRVDRRCPHVGGSYATLPNFGTVTFNNATAVINGVSGTISSPSWQSQAIKIVSNGVTDDTTSVLTIRGRAFR